MKEEPLLFGPPAQCLGYADDLRAMAGPVVEKQPHQGAAFGPIAFIGRRRGATRLAAQY